MSAVVEVLAPGPLTTIQDLGRPGHAALAVPPSGAFDRASFRLANRLVGNADAAAALEVTLGGLALRFPKAATVAFTGALCSGPPDWNAAVTIPSGTELRLGSPARGLSSYVAVRGGIDVPSVLGSRSTDTLSGLGPSRLQTGDLLPIGSDVIGDVSGASASRESGPAVCRIVAGPRDRWFTKAALAMLVRTAWTVGDAADRVGIRLDGPVLARRHDRELPSEAVLPGALQVPPDGRPILFGPDAPVTGGYPVIAVVDDGPSFDRAAQLRPGDTVRFVLE